MHVHTGTDSTTLDPVTAPDWYALSAAMTDEAPFIADRDDLMVTIAPGAGHGAPACFLPALATIEVDGAHLGIDPATAEPHRTGDRDRYAATWGLLTHECAHARHSTWKPPANAPKRAVDAATLLEESRIEAAQVRRRPDDRRWLRASATQLVLADLDLNDPTRAPRMNSHDAARATALILGRTEAGIFTPDETRPVHDTVRNILGETNLNTLLGILRESHAVADDDATAMIELGRRWCRTLGSDPDTPESASHSAEPSPEQPGAPSLSDAISRTTGAIKENVATEATPTDPATRAAESQSTEQAAKIAADKASHRVFSLGGTRSRRHTQTAGTRPPLATERQAARVLARALDRAGVRDRAVTKTTSAAPPGRLRMRGALAADAQRAAGALPTAEPFTRTARRMQPTPPLRVGIACDVSGSMHDYARPVASAAWILAHAAHHTHAPASTATVIFGHHVRPITAPGHTPSEVTEFATHDNYEDIATAIDALDGALDLHRPGAARLLVIVSDGRFKTEPRTDGQTRLNRLRAAGCGVLWLAPDHPTVTPLDGATVHRLTDPTATVRTIGRAAITALRAAAR